MKAPTVVNCSTVVVHATTSFLDWENWCFRRREAMSTIWDGPSSGTESGPQTPVLAGPCVQHDTASSLPPSMNSGSGVDCTTHAGLATSGLNGKSPATLIYTAWTNRRWAFRSVPCLGKRGRRWRFKRPPALRWALRRRRRGRACPQSVCAYCAVVNRLMCSMRLLTMICMCPSLQHALQMLVTSIGRHGAKAIWICSACDVAQTKAERSEREADRTSCSMSGWYGRTEADVEDDSEGLASELVSEGPSPPYDPSRPPAGPPTPQNMFAVEVTLAAAAVLERFTSWSGPMLTRIRGQISRANGITIEMRSMAQHELNMRDVVHISDDPPEADAAHNETESIRTDMDRETRARMTPAEVERVNSVVPLEYVDDADSATLAAPVLANTFLHDHRAVASSSSRPPSALMNRGPGAAAKPKGTRKQQPHLPLFSWNVAVHLVLVVVRWVRAQSLLSGVAGMILSRFIRVYFNAVAHLAWWPTEQPTSLYHGTTVQSWRKRCSGCSAFSFCTSCGTLAAHGLCGCLPGTGLPR